VGTMTTLCCYWRLCYRPMTLLLDVVLWFCPARRLGFACRGEHCECSMVCVSPPCRERAPALSVMDGGRCLLAWGRPQECYISSGFISY
jgi:hypothetical protein